MLLVCLEEEIDRIASSNNAGGGWHGAIKRICSSVVFLLPERPAYLQQRLDPDHITPPASEVSS